MLFPHNNETTWVLNQLQCWNLKTRIQAIITTILQEAHITAARKIQKQLQRRLGRILHFVRRATRIRAPIDQILAPSFIVLPFDNPQLSSRPRNRATFSWNTAMITNSITSLDLTELLSNLGVPENTLKINDFRSGSDRSNRELVPKSVRSPPKYHF